MTDPLYDIKPGDRWLVAVAHPDDETFACGSLIAHASRSGAEVTVVCATRGEAGERQPEIPPEADLGTIREAELHAAAYLLGVARVDLLGYLDSGFDGDPAPGTLCALPTDELTNVFVDIVRTERPVVVAMLDASDGHRDHERVRVCVRRALDALEPTGVLLVETCLPNHLMRRWLIEMREAHPEAAYHAIDPAAFGTPDGVVTDVLDHSDLLQLREAAIALHRSQRSPFDALSPTLRRAFLVDTHVARVHLGAVSAE